MDSLKVDEHYNFPKISIRKEEGSSSDRKVSFGNNHDNMNNYEKENENKSISRNSTEDFWDDVKGDKTKKNNEKTFKKNNFKSKSQTINVQEFSSNSSKKIKYENSLFKELDFDDLITGGKVFKRETETVNENGDESPESVVNFNFKKRIMNTICYDDNYNRDNLVFDYRINSTQSNFSEFKRISNKIDITKDKFNIDKESFPNETNKNNNNFGHKRNYSQYDKNIKEYVAPNKNNTDTIRMFKSPHPGTQTIKQTKNSTPLSNRQQQNSPFKISIPNPKTLERLNLLHNKGKNKEIKIQKKQKELQELNNIKELENCTFKPRINNYTPTKKNLLNARKEMSVYERQILWNNKKLERLEKEKNINKLQENIECTFCPQISKITVDFSTKKADKPTKRFFERINNAKKIKQEMNLKLNPDYNVKYEKIMKIKKKETIDNDNENKGMFVIRENEKDYATFNPKVEEPKIDFETARKNLHTKLISMNMIDEN